MMKFGGVRSFMKSSPRLSALSFPYHHNFMWKGKDNEFLIPCDEIRGEGWTVGHHPVLIPRTCSNLNTPYSTRENKRRGNMLKWWVSIVYSDLHGKIGWKYYQTLCIFSLGCFFHFVGQVHKESVCVCVSSACDEWTVLPKPGLHRDVNRFGHSAVVSNGWVPSLHTSLLKSITAKLHLGNTLSNTSILWYFGVQQHLWICLRFIALFKDTSAVDFLMLKSG